MTQQMPRRNAPTNPTRHPAMMDNRCPICLGDLYTCDCGKVAGRNLSKNYLPSSDEGDE
jgi:hypothetical protein